MKTILRDDPLPRAKINRLQWAAFTLLFTMSSTFAASLPATPEPTWTVPVGLHPRYRNEAPIVRGGRLFFVSHNDFRNHLYSLQATSGATVWRSPFRVTRVDYFADESLRVFTLDRHYLGLHAQTGQEFDGNDLLNQPRVYETNFHPLYVEGMIVTTSPAGELVALAPSGLQWKATPGWQGGLDATPPVAYKDLVLTGSALSSTNSHGGLKAYRQRTGALAWIAEDVKAATAVKVHGDVVLVYEATWLEQTTFVATVRALDGATGKQLWSLATGEGSTGFGWAVEKSQAEGELLILPCSSDLKGPFELRVVDLHTGAARSRFALDAAGFAIHKGVVYAVAGRRVVGLDPGSGAVQWRSAAFADRPSAPFAGDGFVYAGDRHALSAWAVK